MSTPKDFTDPYSTHRELSFDISVSSVAQKSPLRPLHLRLHLQHDSLGALAKRSRTKNILEILYLHTQQHTMVILSRLYSLEPIAKYCAIHPKPLKIGTDGL